jgi:hypothetical protein
MIVPSRWLRVVVFLLLSLFVIVNNAAASGKVGVYAIRMVPYGQDAETYSRASWGGGIHAVLPFRFSEIVALTGGLEFVNFLNTTVDLRDRTTGLKVNQTTSQSYVRLFLGGQVGGHGNGFLRPHAGVNLALIFHDFSIDNTVPDDTNPDKSISQNVEHISRVVFGYDITLGLDLNFSNTIALDGGVKYVKSFSVPQQLGSASLKIYPQYFQIYFGVGVSFDFLRKKEG